ncbi:hypothetical protein B0H16DRAFT_1895497 [Mycena metata]|uniref:Uncharacterized protein n=1 Tax=Mycena metata TaxID=1033252 RepID=A0AAD7HLG3_9AGAR|nr:hypothetical protein B0H16DRAFT_1896135 [Mycena metata]KAJ7724541.1 hypothetical protein B0H16DRAFT_1895497 [Mycena metata]
MIHCNYSSLQSAPPEVESDVQWIPSRSANSVLDHKDLGLGSSEKHGRAKGARAGSRHSLALHTDRLEAALLDPFATALPSEDVQWIPSRSANSVFDHKDLGLGSSEKRGRAKGARAGSRHSLALHTDRLEAALLDPFATTLPSEATLETFVMSSWAWRSVSRWEGGTAGVCGKKADAFFGVTISVSTRSPAARVLMKGSYGPGYILTLDF